MAVVLETSLGDITIDLYTEERPRSCLNFLKLCKIKYYNFCLFHSVQRNLVAQTGDPAGSGRGGQSVFVKLYGDQAAYFDMETKPRIKHQKVGTVSMVNNGSNMHGSQFFITTGDNLDYLDNVHTVFGEVAEGMDVLMKINEAFVDKENRPYQDIRVYHTVILDDPFDDPAGLQEFIPDRSPEPTKEQLENARIGADEEIDDTKGRTTEEIQEMIETREARANAQLLEMVGDLPDADVKPPDNVLFVCKLNPVTTAEDLEIIFSRFGTISSCEVIKDQKTGESLQYAFIEFEKDEDCEKAYFKMDNVLIDDRRVHVDFSQSVAKVKWKGKGKGVEQPSKSKEEELPQFVIKDKSRKDEYELVFDEEQQAVTGSSKSHKKKKKHKRKETAHSSGSDSEPDTRKKDKTRNRSRSPNHHRDRPRDKERESEKEKYGDKDRDHEKDKNKDKDRQRERDRDRNRGRDRDRERDRDRDRGRDRDRDRHRDKHGDKYRD